MLDARAALPKRFKFFGVRVIYMIYFEIPQIWSRYTRALRTAQQQM